MLLRHALYYLAARGLPGLINFAALLLYTRLLAPDEFGRYSLVVASVSLIHVFLFQWLQLVLGRFLPAHRDEPQVVQQSILALFLFIAGSVSVAGLGAALLWSDPVWRALLALAVPLTVAEAWLQLNLKLASTNLRPGRYGFLLGGKSLLAIMVGGWLAWLGLGAQAPLVGMLAGASAAWLLFGLRLWRGMRPCWPAPERLKEYAAYGLPFVATFALGWIIASSDRMLIAWLLDEAATGIYAVGYDLSQHSLGLLLAVVNTAAYPLAVRKLEHEGVEAARAQLAQNGELIITVALTGAAGLAALAPALLDILVGEAFRAGAMKIVPWIAAGAAIAGVKAFHFDLAFQLARKSYLQVYISAVAAIANIALNLLLIPGHGIVGAAWATIIAYGTAGALSWLLGRRVFALPPLAPMLLRGAVVAVVTGLAAWLMANLFSNPPAAIAGGFFAGIAASVLVVLLLDIAGMRGAVVQAVALLRQSRHEV